MNINAILRDFGTVTLSLSSLIAIQLIICGTGMFIAFLAFLCVYEPKINGPLQAIIPIVQIKSLKKKLKKKNKNNQLTTRQQKDRNKQENKHLMSATDTDYMTVQQDVTSQTDTDDEDDEDNDNDGHDHNNPNIQISNLLNI
eukprot:321121_1